MTTSTKAETPEYALGKRLGMLAGAENKSPIPGEDEMLRAVIEQDHRNDFGFRRMQFFNGWLAGYDNAKRKVMAI